MPVQTSYQNYMGEAYPGMLVNMEVFNTISKVNTTSAMIPYGSPVFSDGDVGMKPGAAGLTANQFMGITMRELNRAYTDAEQASGIGVPVGRDGTIVTMGVVYATASVAVAKDDPVYVVLATNAFSNVAGADGTTVLIPNAKWVSTGTAGSLSKISLVNGG